MSHSTLKVVDAAGDVVEHSEYSNGWGFGPRVWDAVVQRYKAKLPSIINPFEEWSALWKAVADKVIDLQPWEWNALVSTYDNVIVASADLAVLADSFERFEKEHPPGDRVSHMLPMAAVFRELASSAGAPGGVCFVGTSVSDDPWNVRFRSVVAENPDDDDYDYRPYNIKRDTKHWYAELRK